MKFFKNHKLYYVTRPRERDSIILTLLYIHVDVGTTLLDILNLLQYNEYNYAIFTLMP